MLHKKLQHSNEFISVLEKTQTKYVLIFSNGRCVGNKKGIRGAKSSLSFDLPHIIDLDFELKPVSVQFLKISPDHETILCTHGHCSFFPYFGHI